jgi:beta-lactam-binding protein with PASTA domain
MARVGIDAGRRIGQVKAKAPSQIGRVVSTDPPAGAAVSAGDLATLYVGT